MEAVEIKDEAAKLIILCLMTASLSLFLQKCFETGMIFRRYYLILVLAHIRSWRSSDRWKRPILKVWGLCIYCNGTWVFIALFILINAINETKHGDNTSFLANTIALFLGIGLNYIWIKILKKL